MAKYSTATITTQTDTDICKISTPRGLDATDLLVSVTGTFNGATATLSVSPDGGTTYAPLEDNAGTAIAFTADGATTIKIPCAVANQDAPVILAVTTSVANPTGIVATAFDVR